MVRVPQRRAAASACGADFDVLVTIDQRMRYQQNFARTDIGVVVIDVRDTRLVHLRPLVPTFVLRLCASRREKF